MSPNDRSRKPLGDLELEVLKVIWEEEPCRVSDVAQVMADRSGHARTTILTIIQRLHAKGHLHRRKKDGVWRYTTARNKGTVLMSLVRGFVEDVLDGSPAPLVSWLADSGRLKPCEVKRLEALVTELEKRERNS